MTVKLAMSKRTQGSYRRAQLKSVHYLVAAIPQGADYREMIDLTRKIYPDIRQLINVDGGGSAVMGLVTHGSFLELNVPAASGFSCVGMVRPVHTVLYIPLEHDE